MAADQSAARRQAGQRFSPLAGVGRRGATRRLAAATLTLAAVAAAYIGAGRSRQLRWGATDEELGTALAGDDLITAPDLTATRAITIHAPADLIWPWIAQLGPGPRRLLHLRLARESARPQHTQRGSRRQRVAGYPGRGPDQAGRKRWASRNHR